jgi:uncharacterized membrane protein YadS
MTTLRIGVVLLGLRITIKQLYPLWPPAMATVAANIATIMILGLLLARLYKFDQRL